MEMEGSTLSCRQISWKLGDIETALNLSSGIATFCTKKSWIKNVLLSCIANSDSLYVIHSNSKSIEKIYKRISYFFNSK